MKKNLAILVAVVMVFGLTACSSSPKQSSVAPATDNSSLGTPTPTDDGKTYELHVAYSVAENENSQHTIKFNKIKELVEEQTNGKVKIIIHPGGELGAEKEYIEMLQNGEIAMASVATSMLSGFTPALALFDCPFLFEDQQQLIKFIEDGKADDRIAMLEDIGLISLGLNSVGARNFLTVQGKPIESLADMSGKKLRTMQTEIQIRALEVLGAQPMPLAYSECYQSMQTGVIDGMENEVDTYLAMKFYEVAPNYTEAGWLQLVHTTLASKEVIDSLPEEYQQIIRDAVIEGSNLATQKGIEYKETAAEAALVDANVNVIRIDNTEFREKLQTSGFYDEFNDLIGQEVIDWIVAN